MTTTEAQELLTEIGAGLSDRLTELNNSIHELQQCRNQLNELWAARDYQALRDCGFLSARQLAAYQVASATLEANE